MDEYYDNFYNLFSEGCAYIFMQEFARARSIKTPYNLLQNFQIMLSEMPKWSVQTFEKKWQELCRRSECEWLDNYTQSIFYTKFKNMVYVCFNNNVPEETYRTFRPPSNPEFLMDVTIHCARVFYKDPYLFYHKSGEDRIKKMEKIRRVIVEQTKLSIQKYLPTKQFLINYSIKDVMLPAEHARQDVASNPLPATQVIQSVHHNTSDHVPQGKYDSRDTEIKTMLEMSCESDDELSMQLSGTAARNAEQAEQTERAEHTCDENIIDADTAGGSVVENTLYSAAKDIFETETEKTACADGSEAKHDAFADTVNEAVADTVNEPANDTVADTAYVSTPSESVRTTTESLHKASVRTVPLNSESVRVVHAAVSKNTNTKGVACHGIPDDLMSDDSLSASMQSFDILKKQIAVHPKRAFRARANK